MIADISLAPVEPLLPLVRPKFGARAIVPILGVTLVSYFSFGVVFALMITVATRALGAPDSVMWFMGGLGAIVALFGALWFGCVVWRDGEQDGVRAD